MARDPLPMFPIGGVALPGSLLPLRVFEPRYRELLRAIGDDPEFGSVLIERGSEVGGGDQRMRTGCLIQVLSAEDHGSHWEVVGVGTRRLRVEEWLEDDPYPRARVAMIDEPAATEDDRRLTDAVRARWGLLDDERQALGDATLASLDDTAQDPALFSFQAAAIAPIGPLDRFRILDADTPHARLVLLLGLLDDQITDCQHRRRVG